VKNLFITLGLVFILAACESSAPASYVYTPPATPGGLMCANQCRLAHDYGLEACDLAYRNCVSNVQAQALKDYGQYTREQFDSNQPMDLYISDFERKRPCDDARTRCNGGCENDYKSCYKNCGGTVSEAGSCQLFSSFSSFSSFFCF
jgi:hypothetical protein